MEIRQLKAFQTIASLHSFIQAADRLNYAQSSISAQIKALEEELDVRLFDRLGRKIVLTEAGERLLPFARKIIALAEEGRAEISGAAEPQGSLTIRIPETLGVYRLAPILGAFRNRFAKIELRFTTCAHEGLQKDLRKGVTDLAFLLAESIQAADLGSEVLGFESIVLVAPAGHPLARRRKVKTSDLAGETLLLSRVDCSYLRTFKQILNQAGVRPAAGIEMNSVAAIKAGVRTGLGLTVLPEVSVAEDLADNKMVLLPWDQGKLEMATLMIWYKERWRSPALNAFMAHVRRSLKEVYPESRS